ncbi:MAG TPA: hypothetical protein VJ729_08060 [Nitrososphaeraceae archaeon]|nr:hypothetical protein [Nitrososphaeraceae archaeon]
MMTSKANHKDQKELQESDDEEYQTDQRYEQERFTDEYSEYNQKTAAKLSVRPHFQILPHLFHILR